MNDDAKEFALDAMLHEYSYETPAGTIYNILTSATDEVELETLFDFYRVRAAPHLEGASKLWLCSQIKRFAERAAMLCYRAKEPGAAAAIKLINEDGENLAVRAFLAAYEGGSPTVWGMRHHMKRCGFHLWPACIYSAKPDVYMTLQLAQDWLRHLFALEKTGR